MQYGKNATLIMIMMMIMIIMMSKAKETELRNGTRDRSGCDARSGRDQND
jgi:hypothetical protein